MWSNSRFMKNLMRLSLLGMLSLAACGDTVQERCKRLEKAGNQYYAASQYRKALDAWSELLTIKPDAAPAVHQKTRPLINVNLQKWFLITSILPVIFQV